MARRPTGTITAVAAALLTACAPRPTSSDRPLDPPVRYAVITDHPLATDTAAEMLEQGGSAADAAVAAAAALMVLRPDVCGPGGAMSVVIRDGRTGRAEALVAVVDADSGPTPGDTQAFAVPSALHTLIVLHELHGRLPIGRVLAPAIALASAETPIDGRTFARAADLMLEFGASPERIDRTSLLWRRLLLEGYVLLSSRLTQPELAEALQLIAREGRPVLHTGPIAGAIVEATRAAGSEIGFDTLRSVRVLRVPARQQRSSAAVISTVPGPDADRLLTLMPGTVDAPLPHAPGDPSTPSATRAPPDAARIAVVDATGTAIAAHLAIGAPFGARAGVDRFGFLLAPSGAPEPAPPLLVHPPRGTPGTTVAAATAGGAAQAEAMAAAATAVLKGVPPLEAVTEARASHGVHVALVTSRADGWFDAAQTPPIAGPGRVNRAPAENPPPGQP